MAIFEPDLGPEGHGAYRLLRWVNGGLVKRFVADLGDPEAASQRCLGEILALTRGTAFSADHGLDRVDGLEALRSQVPVRTYSDLRPWLDRVADGERHVLTREHPSMLLETSGTTGVPKLLPVTAAWARGVQEAQRLWTLALVRDHPTLASGKALTMVSPAVHGQSSGGLAIGSNTGRIRRAQPGWLRRRFVVPDAVARVRDPVVRQYITLVCACGADVRSITTANPSLLLLMFRRMKEWEEPLRRDVSNGTLAHGIAAHLDPSVRRAITRHLTPTTLTDDLTPTALWPHLASVNCWTYGPAAYYAKRLQEQLPMVQVRELGVTASEGTFAFPLAPDWPGSVLWSGGSLVEFLCRDGTLKWAWELEVGDVARLIVTTRSGLMRYDMADEVEVVGHCDATPMVRFLGKAGRYLNRVGERVSEGQISAAMDAVGVQLAGFTVHAPEAEIPSYIVGFEGENVDESFAKSFDSALAQQNVEYAGKRASGRLGPPVIRRFDAGHYAQLRAHRVDQGAPEGQLKDPVIAVDQSEWDRVCGAGWLS